jgi:hypothetical protein
MLMNKTIISIMAVMLCGCVDLGRVGLHPELKTAYFDGQKHIVESCLYSAALSQKLSLMKDDSLPGGTERYDLQDANYENVAWVDITPSGEKQTSATRVIPLLPDSQRSADSPPPVPGAARVFLLRSRGSE